MNQLLVICGPTATGKTSLALKLANKFDWELISADSRQVYKYMNVVTGKDLPTNSKFQISNVKVGNLKVGYYTDGKIRLWGYDLVNPNEDFSVAHFIDFSSIVIKDILDRGKLPILVGGTGLYLRAAVYGIDTAVVPQNAKLRKSLDDKKALELLTMFEKLDGKKADSLNNSDKNNPRRLIRAIEIAKNESKTKVTKTTYNSLWIGLTVKNRETLFERIDARVEKRIGKKMDTEIEFLKSKDYLRYVPSRTLGYKQWIEYLDSKVAWEDAIEKWKLAEHSYAKRQMTWFKKQKSIKWFNVTSADYVQKVEEKVNTWHNVK